MSTTDSPEPTPNRHRQLSRRGFIAGAGGAAGLGILGLRLLYLQGFDPAGHAEQARSERTRVQTVPALRGEIMDINGNVLARSVQRYNITVDQTAVQEYERFIPNTNEKETITPTQLVYKLADILKMKDTEVKAALDGDSKYKVIKENVPPEVYDSISDLGATFVYGEILSDRLYPNGQVGGSIVGRFSMIEEAVEGSDQTQMTDYSVGIERVMGDVLAGTDGERVYEISADGVRIPVGDEQVKPSVNGKNVRLTIDQDIQYFAQQVIKKRVEDTEAQWGTVVVMKVKDGSILALADSFTMDPGSDKFELEDMTPRAISQAVEPGSTEKILTASAVMEEGLVEPRTVFDIPPELEIEGQTINDAFSHPAEKRTFSGIITDSMNTGTVMAGSKLSREQRYNWLKKYGMGDYTGIELTGESQGMVTDYNEWDIRQQYTILFGQGVSQTPLQTSLIYQTIGNLGVKLKPRIIDAVISEDGVEEVRPVEEGVRVVSEETARKALSLMENVVIQNAKGAQVEGYRVGGKTGTAEAPSETKAGYDGYTTSFCGVAPLEDPQFMVSVTLQRPKADASNVGSAGTQAQFSEIMEKVLQTYHVPFSTTEPVEIPKFEEDLKGSD
ncbi:peptidoglycan D,D-transpeptidase FtsI family protein [Rothia aerolata]|uniref:Cell division protein FtsI n=1 Tax=Rothia aerolata TaxID=1812262 RepID=A0A917MPI5_9MICC|nr:penicillin-binding protein 2 [Rothia aerolata]GGH56450.1 cell division protein FtsI [Rothia aerolata]